MRSILKRQVPLVLASVFAITLVWAAPASAASALVVTPHTNLVDFQTVTVAGSGFPANTTLGLAQCTNGATDPTTDCDLSFLQFVTTDNNGNYSTPFTVERLINTSAGQIDCAPSNCAMFSSDLNLGSLTTTPLEFDPNVPPQPRLQLTLTVNPTGTVVAKNGTVTIRGTVSCNLPADVFVDVSLQQRAGRVFIQGDAFTEVQCDGTTSWAATGQGSNGIFKGGKVQADVFASGSSGTQSAFVENLTTVKLSGKKK
jgi:hypothetical protein